MRDKWPPLLATGKPTAGVGLTVSKLATITRSDGTRQITYNGHPLYLFVKDHKPGDVNGQGVTAFGAAWFALSPPETSSTPHPPPAAEAQAAAATQSVQHLRARGRPRRTSDPPAPHRRRRGFGALNPPDRPRHPTLLPAAGPGC